MEQVGLFEAMHSQRAIRRYRADPVPEELIRKVLDAAIRAPSATNTQQWRFVVVRDPATRTRLCDYYARAWDDSYSNPATKAGLDTKDQKVITAAARFAKGGVRDVPVFILVFSAPKGAYASVLPAAQNIMLAARGLGLGTIITTLLRLYEKEVKHLVGAPESAELVVTIPLGYPAVAFGPNRRTPVQEVTFLERWGEKPEW